MSNRKAVEKEIIKMMDAWVPGSGNKELYISKFKSMSDSDFDKMMLSFKNEEDTLRVVIPNFKKSKITVEHNFKVAKSIGHSFLERCWLTSSETGLEYLTPHEYLVVKLPLRRQSQLLFKKLQVPKNNNAVDSLTGQATGESKGSAITAPESQILMSLGMERTLEETMKIRGGDRASMVAFDKSIIETGIGDADQATASGGIVKSNEALALYLNGLHISNTVA